MNDAADRRDVREDLLRAPQGDRRPDPPARTTARRACCAGATACSNRFPVWPRRWPPKPWPTSSAARSPASSSRPTCCRPTSSARASTERSSETFDVELGPVFVNFLLTDEINRAPAKVQSALLEVMAEQQVTIGGITHPVPTPFFVVATQNPIESEGVYQLPDAQRDRFMMKIVLDYPTADEELTIIDRMSISAPDPAAGDLARRADRPPGARRRGVRRPIGVAVRRRPGAVHPRPGPVRAGRPRHGDRSRRQPPSVAEPGAWRPSPGADAGPLVRHTTGRVRPGPGDPSPPAAAHLRRTRTRHHRRPRRPTDPRHRAGHLGVTEAERRIRSGRSAG